MRKFDFREVYLNNLNLKTSQNYSELNGFLNWVENLVKVNNNAPFKYIEIGSYAGESLYYISQILPENSLITIVDLGDNKVANKVLEEKIIPLISKKHEVLYLKGDARNPEAVNKAKAKGPYNLCFIDANHNFEFAIEDFKNYGPFSHWISFHDISKFNTAKTKSKYGVYQANANHIWECIKLMWPSHFNTEAKEPARFEFIDHNDSLQDFLKDPEFYNKNTNIDKPRGFGITANFFGASL
jgi:hypothetical protein